MIEEISTTVVVPSSICVGYMYLHSDFTLAGLVRNLVFATGLTVLSGEVQVQGFFHSISFLDFSETNGDRFLEIMGIATVCLCKQHFKGKWVDNKDCALYRLN